ncbi:MAG: hypothetical protein ACREJM_03640, partial [Candidatus Saccharimonadales bacterium]
VLGPETLQNLSLRPAIARGLMRLPAGHVARLEHAWYFDFLDLPPVTAGRIAKAALLLLLALVAWLVRGPVVRRDDAAVLWECAAVGVLALLLSPITWYQHCVALVPPFYLLARTAASGARADRWDVSIAVLFVAVHLVLSRGLIGRDLTLLMASYHVTTWTLVAVLFATLAGRPVARETVLDEGNPGHCSRPRRQPGRRPLWLGQRSADAPTETDGSIVAFRAAKECSFAARKTK